MINAVGKIFDPVYFYQPSQALRRLYYWYMGTPAKKVADLAWGGRLFVDGSEKLGEIILHRGVMDLEVAEACFRLSRPRTTAVDVGANVGQMTSALAHAMQEGDILSFEPHPDICYTLRKNKDLIHKEKRRVTIEIFDKALGAESGHATLNVPKRWSDNAGVASIRENRQSEGLPVKVERIDDVMSGNIQLMKLDVEGFEKEVLKGAADNLVQKRIRHIIFEEHNAGGSETERILAGLGYRVFAIEKRLRGPELTDEYPEGTYNFVGTAHPEEAIASFENDGWQSLNS